MPRPTPAKPDGLEFEARRVQRLHTATALKSERTPLAVISAAENAVTVAEDAIGRAVQRQPPSPSIACREGCCWCCYKVVGTSAAEVLRIADYLRQHLSTEDLQRLREHVAQLDDQRRALRKQGPWAARRLPCPLLVNERCSIYSVRPLTCRGFNSSDARACEAWLRSRNRVDVPVYAPQQHVTTFVLDGLRAGLMESGLRDDLLELNAALRIALTAPDAAERWLAGEPVFGAARLS